MVPGTCRSLPTPSNGKLIEILYTTVQAAITCLKIQVCTNTNAESGYAQYQWPIACSRNRHGHRTMRSGCVKSSKWTKHRNSTRSISQIVIHTLNQLVVDLCLSRSPTSAFVLAHAVFTRLRRLFRRLRCRCARCRSWSWSLVFAGFDDLLIR